MAKKIAKSEGKVVEVNFVKEKETKNTIKYSEVPEEGQPPIVGTLYVQKWFAGSANNVKITLSIGE